MTNQTKASPVRLRLGTAALLGTCSNFHQTLPGLCIHPHTHQATVNGPSAPFIPSFIYQQQPASLSVTRLNVTAFHISSQTMLKPDGWGFTCKVMFCEGVQRRWLGHLLSETLLSDPDTHKDAHKQRQKQPNVGCAHTTGDVIPVC